MPESAAAAIARLDGKMSTHLAEVKGQLDVIAERLAAGDKEAAQALGAVQYRVQQLETHANKSEDQRRNLRNLAIAAFLFSPITGVMTFFLTKALGG